MGNTAHKHHFGRSPGKTSHKKGGKKPHIVPRQENERKAIGALETLEGDGLVDFGSISFMTLDRWKRWQLVQQMNSRKF